MLPIKKLYIDTRFKTSNSRSDTDFSVNLPSTFMMPDDAVFYIDDISIPVSWQSIQAGRNNKLYFAVNGVVKIVELATGNYNVSTLNTEVVSKMNAAFPGENLFSSAPVVKTNQIKIICNATLSLEILTDEQLLKLGYSYPLQSCNDVLRNTEANDYNQNAPFVSNYIDFFPIRNLYLVSSNLGNFNTMSISGECGIMKNLNVNANYGEMLFDSVVLGSDYLDCSKQLLSQLNFRLVDIFGNVINLNNNHWSFSIVFAKRHE